MNININKKFHKLLHFYVILCLDMFIIALYDEGVYDLEEFWHAVCLKINHFHGSP